MLPNFLIIGAPRAGTTWMAKNMMGHPDIYMPRVKEIHFFDRHYEKGFEYYKEYFKDVNNQTSVGEATPEYLYIPEVAERIRKHLPEVKLIVSLRDPVERLYSRYWNSRAKYQENKDLSFEEKIKQKPLFIEEGYYYDHLVRYYSFFPKEQILILLYEDLQADPSGYLNDIYKFLGISNEYMSEYQDIKINSAASKKYVGKSQLLWNLNRVFMRLRLFSIAQKIDVINRNEYPSMNPDTKKWLREMYREKNEKLQKLIDRDLGIWNM